MNINLLDATPTKGKYPLPRVQQLIDGNAEVLQRAGDYRLTGRVALTSTNDLAVAGVYQLWHETDDGKWVWVDDEGVLHEAPSPLYSES